MDSTNDQIDSLQIQYKNHELPDKITIPSAYPDARYVKTNIARPSLKNVIHAKEWVEYDQL